MRQSDFLASVPRAQQRLPPADLSFYDVRPHVVPDALASGTCRGIRHLLVPLVE
jgi:hypothetical protein